MGTVQSGTAHRSTHSTHRTVQYPDQFRYCTVPAVPVGTAVLQIGTAVLHSTEHVLRYCSSDGYCGYCSPVLCSTQKRSQGGYFFGEIPHNDPGIELRAAGVYGDVIIIAPPLRVIIGWLIIGLFTP